ncbi:hypothetical protein [Anaerobiospirillum succiniciproducens]|nr:hypothetical protein [Anaerobiospirillum succiniciproducens]
MAVKATFALHGSKDPRFALHAIALQSTDALLCMLMSEAKGPQLH